MRCDDGVYILPFSQEVGRGDVAVGELLSKV